MFKKILTAIIVCLVLGLAACGGKKTTVNNYYGDGGSSDTTPDASSVAFTSITGAAKDTDVSCAAPATVSGINAPAPISVSGGKYSINGGTYTTDAGTAANGDKICVQVHTSSADNTAITATVTIGGVSGTFSVTTATADGNSSGSPVLHVFVTNNTQEWPMVLAENTATSIENLQMQTTDGTDVPKATICLRNDVDLDGTTGKTTKAVAGPGSTGTIPVGYDETTDMTADSTNPTIIYVDLLEGSSTKTHLEFPVVAGKVAISVDFTSFADSGNHEAVIGVGYPKQMTETMYTKWVLDTTGTCGPTGVKLPDGSNATTETNGMQPSAMSAAGP